MSTAVKTIDALRDEMNRILEMIGKEATSVENKEIGLARVSEIMDEMVIISKQGDAPMYIINLLPKRWTISRSYCIFTINPKPDGADYSVTEITGKSGKIDTGRGGQVRENGLGWRVKLDGLYYTAKQIATDVAREINGDLPALQAGQVRDGKRIEKSMGVFVSPTRKPAPELLEKHRATLNVYYTALVDEGNILWRKSHDYRQVSDLCREACDYLGIATEWHQSLDMKAYCAGCGIETRKGIAVCGSCGAVQDWDKAHALGMLNAKQEKQYEENSRR